MQNHHEDMTKFENAKTKRALLCITYGVLLYLGASHLGVLGSAFSWVIAVVMPIIYGVSIAFVVNLFLGFLRSKVFFRMAQAKKAWVRRLCPMFCVLTTIGLVAAILSMVIFTVIPQITSAFSTLLEKIPESSGQLLALLDEKLTAMHAPAFISKILHEIDTGRDSLFQLLANMLNGSAETVLGATRVLFSAVTNLLLGTIIAIYILANKKRVLYVLRKILELLIPRKYRTRIFRILRLTNDSFASFLTGQFKEAAIIGVLCWLGLAAFGFPYAFTIGVLTGITALLPIIGAWIGGALGLLLVLAAAPQKAIRFLIFILLLQQFEEQFIYPRVVGDSIGLPGLLVLIAVILGGGLGGMAGMLLAVPLSAVGYSLLKDAIDSRSS